MSKRWSYPKSKKGKKSKYVRSPIEPTGCIIFKESAKRNEAHTITVATVDNVNLVYHIFFKHETCYDLIPASAKLVVLDIELDVKKALYGLLFNGVRAAMLWDSMKQAFVGMLTITDFIKILVKLYRSNGQPMDELETHKISTWRAFSGETDNSSLISITPDNSLLAAAESLIRHKVHRLPIIDPVGGNPLHILTHKRILNYLYIKMSQMPTPPFMVRTLSELQLGTYVPNVCVAKADMPLIRVFELFVSRKVSAMPVVDDEMQLVDLYSKFDVINLAANRTYSNLDITLDEVLHIKRDGKPLFNGVLSCFETDTLKDIIVKIVTAGVHRLVIVDDHNHVRGIVSLSDILKFIVQDSVKLYSSGHS